MQPWDTLVAVLAALGGFAAGYGLRALRGRAAQRDAQHPRRGTP